MEKFGHIDTWVFDLDNTLYDADTHVFVECGRRMTEFVEKHLSLTNAEAAALRQSYFQKYGTTLRGLMTEHNINPQTFLDHVHGFDISHVPQCPVTVEGLAQLSGPKVVFTNAPIGFAEEMTRQLGIRHHFNDIFAIEHADFWPKPHPDTYHAFLKKHDINPKTACMFEDMEINLRPAHDLGMTTVWLHGKHQDPHADLPHVHHRAEKLSDWIEKTVTKGN